jgi:hypothetical protein
MSNSPHSGARPEDKCADYEISVRDADELRGICGLPHEFRLMRLKQLFSKRPAAALELFSQFIGLANSVVNNNRDMAELILITEGQMYSHEAEKANLPTIFGALNGISIAASVDQRKTCIGCAFRLATCANQSPVTTCDVKYVMDCDQPFMCHLELDEHDEPVRMCAGYQQIERPR